MTLLETVTYRWLDRRLMRATPRPGCRVRDLLPEETPGSVEPESCRDRRPAEEKPLLRVTDLVKEFPLSRSAGRHWLRRISRKRERAVEPETFRAVDGISFDVGRGRSVGLVGESGCGKSTTSAMIMRLMEATSGSIELDGVDLTTVPVQAFARSPHRARLQMVFQDPTDSLNPRFTAARAISDPIRMLGSDAHRRDLRARVEDLAGLVGLPVELLDAARDAEQFGMTFSDLKLDPQALRRWADSVVAGLTGGLRC